jgi:4-amino-4-deoxy-L-arabinose transferase-like glycosyltransferase
MTDRQESALFWFLSLVLITVTTLARYWFVLSGQLNLAPDEAQYWDWSRTLQWSYYSKGPLIAVINYLGTAFLGATEMGVRAGAMVGALVMQLAVLGWIGLYLGRIRTAFWTLFVLNTTMLFMAGGLLMTTDNPLLVCWILALICLHLAVDKGHLAAFVLLGLFVALGITAKYTMALFIPLALLAAFWIGRKQELPALFWPRLLKTLGIGGVLGMLPILIWNAGNGWVGIKHVLYRGAMAGDKAKVFFELKNFPEYLGSQLGVLTPWWFVFLFLGAWLVGRQIFRTTEPVFPWLPRSMGIMLTVFFWPVWLFFLLWSLHTKIEANWSATAYPAGILLAALAVERFVHRDPRPKWRFAWPALGAVVFILLHLQGFIPFDGPKNPVHRLLGWQDLGAQVAQARDELGGEERRSLSLEANTGSRRNWLFTSRARNRAFCLPGGRKMNQYDLWPGPDPAMTDAVFVVKGEKAQVSDRVFELFESVDEPRVVITTHGRRTGQTFTIFLCRGYKGVWPEQEGSTF